MVLDTVLMVSKTRLFFDRGPKMDAKCSLVTVRGIVWVMEMGRWREKKLDSPTAITSQHSCL